MRKVLSFVLVLSLVLGSFSMAFAATPKDVVGEPSEDAVTVLSDLGVVSGYEDGTYKPENIVTRAEMAVLVIRALGLTDYVSGTAKSSFKDMAGYGWADGYVAYAQSLGFVSGYPDGTFKPGQTVSYDEAASMLIRALGYTPESLTGTWPANFVVRAKALGILDDVQAGPKGANRGDVAIMLYQTLDCAIGTVDKEGNWAEHKDKNGNANDFMLSRLGAKLANGGDPFVLLNTDSALINTIPYVGAFVKAYENKDGDIIAIAEVNSTFLTGKYTKANVFKADGVEYTLTSGTTGYTFDKVSYDAKKFDNGQIASPTTVGAITTATGIVTLGAKVSGKSVKEVYSVTKWNGEAAFQFEADMLADKAINGYAFKKDDNKEIDLNSFALMGVDSLDAIKKDNVVVVYLDVVGSGKVVKVEVGTQTVAGKITLEDDGDYTIAGKVYSLADNPIDTPNLGETGTAYLDYNGDIMFWDIDKAESGNYAIVTDLYKPVGRDNTIVLLTKDGKETEYVVADKVDDGTDFTTAGAVGATGIKTSVGALTVGDLVTFSTNKSGKIDKMVSVGTTTSSLQLSASRAVYGNELVDSGVVVFTTDGAYDIGNIADLETKTNLIGTRSYSVDGKVKVLVVSSVYTGSDSVYAVLNSWNDAYDNNDDKAQYLTGFAGGKEYKAYTDDSGVVSGATTGAVQVWELTVDSNGKVVRATTTAGVAGTPVVTIGEVKEKNGSLIKDATTWYTIDKNMVVYELKDGKYSAKSLSSVRAATPTTSGSAVELYKLDKDSEVYDLIIIK